MPKKYKTIHLLGQEISYSLASYRSSRRLRVSIYGNGEISVTKPYSVSERALEAFLIEKSAWILEKIASQRAKNPYNPVSADSLDNYLRYKNRAEAMIIDRIRHLNRFYGFEYKKVSVRRQKTRWGSCSRAGNLSFNYRLIFLKPAEADYVIVHELCHLKEFNHSPAFWDLVAKVVPDYRVLRRKLKIA